MPTPEQLESRKTLAEFIERVGGTINKLGTKAKSAWFSRPDDELKGWIERGRAIKEIEDSLGYRLITETIEREIGHAQRALEICPETELNDWRIYLKSLRFVQEFILTTNRNADISSSVLAGRAGNVAKDSVTFIRNAQVRG